MQTLLLAAAVSFGASRTFEKASLRNLHEHGLLAESHVAGLRLKSVYVAHRHSPSSAVGHKKKEKRRWRLSRTDVPEPFHSRLFDEESEENTQRGRLLSTYPKSAILETAAGIGFAYRTPRDKLLSVTAVLAASIPLAAYNVTFHYEKWKTMYDNGTSLYVNWCDEVNETTNCLNLSNDTKFSNLAQIEKEVLTDARTQIKTVMGTSYASDNFIGSRQTGCSDDEELEEENLPPWRQLKPWRWKPPEEDLGWLKMFQLPKVQVDEAGRSYIIGLYAGGICIFFTFVWWGPPQARSILTRRPAPDGQ